MMESQARPTHLPLLLSGGLDPRFMISWVEIEQKKSHKLRAGKAQKWLFESIARGQCSGYMLVFGGVSPFLEGEGVCMTYLPTFAIINTSQCGHVCHTWILRVKFWSVPSLPGFPAPERPKTVTAAQAELEKIQGFIEPRTR